MKAQFRRHFIVLAVALAAVGISVAGILATTLGAWALGDE